MISNKMNFIYKDKYPKHVLVIKVLFSLNLCSSSTENIFYDICSSDVSMPRKYLIGSMVYIVDSLVSFYYIQYTFVTEF